MEAELAKFRQKKQTEERNLRVKEKFENFWNRITSSLSAAVLPEPEPLKNSNISSSSSDNDSSCSSEEEEDEEEDNQTINDSDKKLLVSKVTKDKKKTKKKLKRKKTTDPPNNDDLLLDANPNKWAVLAIRVSKFLMWLLTFVGFVKIGFGAVFFAVSALIFMYLNTETRRKRRKKGEKSAYSVFNENCEAIDGAVSAEQLEKQMIYGNLVM